MLPSQHPPADDVACRAFATCSCAMAGVGGTLAMAGNMPQTSFGDNGTRRRQFWHCDQQAIAGNAATGACGDRGPPPITIDDPYMQKQHNCAGRQSSTIDCPPRLCVRTTEPGIPQKIVTREHSHLWDCSPQIALPRLIAPLLADSQRTQRAPPKRRQTPTCTHRRGLAPRNVRRRG